MADRKLPRDAAHFRDLLGRLAATEEQFLMREFLAPALHGGTVSVRIGGAVCAMDIEPASFAGWGVFRPLSYTRAQLMRPATLSERRKYLELFPVVRLIVTQREGPRWFGCAANFADCRVRIEGLVPILLTDEVQTFDLVRCRWDGTRFWFDEIDPIHSAAAAAYLREALNRSVDPVDLQRPGLTPEERTAYEVNCWRNARPSGSSDRHEMPGAARATLSDRRVGEHPHDVSDPALHRLRRSLSHAGAQLIDYLERGDSYRVTYLIDGREYTSSVEKQDLTVQVSGICLSGQDRDFDLASLVGVLREGVTRDDDW